MVEVRGSTVGRVFLVVFAALLVASTGFVADATAEASGPFSSDEGQVRHKQIGLTLLSGPIVRPGTMVRFRLFNESALPVSFGQHFEVQALGHQAWSRAAFSPRGPWTEQRFDLLPGRNGRAQAVLVPRSAAPGHYRIVKQVWGNHRTLRLKAAFVVR